jgi:hypothetical protein
MQLDGDIHFDSKCLPITNRFASSTEYSATYKNAISEGILCRIQMLCQAIQNSSSPDGKKVDWVKVRRRGFAAFETCSISKREYYDKSVRKRVARFRLEIGDRWVGESASYSKDDLWILSSVPFIWDRKGTIVCALSRYYGIGKDHTLEIVPISRPDSLHMLCTKGSSNTFAFRIDSIGTDIQMLHVLEEYGKNGNACKFSPRLLGIEAEMTRRSPPDAICRPSHPHLIQEHLSCASIYDISLEFEEKHHLNDEQKKYDSFFSEVQQLHESILMGEKAKPHLIVYQSIPIAFFDMSLHGTVKKLWNESLLFFWFKVYSDQERVIF